MFRRGLIMRFLVMSAILALLTAALGAGVYLLTQPGEAVEVRASLLVSDALNMGDSGFEFVTRPREFVFPEDHGPHPKYALEWWYYTGNLETSEGRRFGYELTFFRRGVGIGGMARSSEWATGQIYFAHFALTDVENGEFYAFERFSRDALGLAGANATPFRIWIEDWSTSGADDGILPTRLKASDEDAAIDLVLNSEKPIVLHGEGGYSRKGSGLGEASYYYSMTRMPTTGMVSVEGISHSVSGLSWLDREWSSAQLSDDYVGWDWFALQLSDGRDIMYYQLRPRDGVGNGLEAGTLVVADGSYSPLGAADVNIQTLDHWESPLGGTYPSRWRFRIPSEGLDIEITPYISDQELDTVVRYWEGAVRIEGMANGLPVGGSGYVELTGYAESPSP
jgi:predicted secreted hydrolase